MVGYAAPGLGFFAVQSEKRVRSGANKHATALIKIKEGHIDDAGLSAALALNFPMEWNWQARENGPQSFLVKFPSLAKIDECSQYEQFKLKGHQVQISVDRWSSAALAKAKLFTVWVKAKRVLEDMLTVDGVFEIGSSLGAVQQIDLESLNNYEVVKFKVDVKDPELIPENFEFAQKPYLYDIYFEMETVVETWGPMPRYERVATPRHNKPSKQPGKADGGDQVM
uniref:Uncharacterized protein n=1 Tax=Arundo donax TaxID=35708 RepID=A0A0A8YM91_ARUDO